MIAIPNRWNIAEFARHNAIEAGVGGDDEAASFWLEQWIKLMTTKPTTTTENT